MKLTDWETAAFCILCNLSLYSLSLLFLLPSNPALGAPYWPENVVVQRNPTSIVLKVPIASEHLNPGLTGFWLFHHDELLSQDSRKLYSEDRVPVLIPTTKDLVKLSDLPRGGRVFVTARSQQHETSKALPLLEIRLPYFGKASSWNKWLQYTSSWRLLQEG